MIVYYGIQFSHDNKLCDKEISYDSILCGEKLSYATILCDEKLDPLPYKGY